MSNWEATAEKTPDAAGKSAGVNGVTAGAEGKASAISAQIKIKTKTALVDAGFTDAEAAAKVNNAKTIDDINSLLQEASAKKKAAEEAAGNSDRGAQQPSDNGNQQAPDKPKESAGSQESVKKTSDDAKTDGGDEGKPISAKEIIGLKKKLKASGKTDDDLAKILPGVKTVGDYNKVIKEYGIAA